MSSQVLRSDTKINAITVKHPNSFNSAQTSPMKSWEMIKSSSTQCSFGRSTCHSRVNNGRKERNGWHYWIAMLWKRHWLVHQRAEMTARAIIIKVRVFDRQTQEVQNAFVLCATTDMLSHAIPIIFVHLEAFEQQQRFLVSPLTATCHCSTVLLALHTQSTTFLWLFP